MRESVMPKGLFAGMCVAVLMMTASAAVFAQAPAAGDKKKGNVEVTASKEAQFDAEARIATFVGEVKVVDPQFTMTADKLVVEMLKEGGMKKAVATGNVIIVAMQATKSAPDEPPTKSQGWAEKAVYEPSTGDITLTGNPKIQQGINLHIATSPSTTMTLNRNGKMRTEGPNKTVMKENEAVNE